MSEKVKDLVNRAREALIVKGIPIPYDIEDAFEEGANERQIIRTLNRVNYEYDLKLI